MLLGGDYNECHSHPTDNLQCYDQAIYKATNYLNPTYNSNINLCINDDYISIIGNDITNANAKSNNTYSNISNINPSELKENERESNELDENMNFVVTPLINAIDLNNHNKVPKNLTGKLRNALSTNFFLLKFI